MWSLKTTSHIRAYVLVFFIYCLNSETKSVHSAIFLHIINNFNRGSKTLSLNSYMICVNSSLYSYSYTRIFHLVFKQFLTRGFEVFIHVFMFLSNIYNYFVIVVLYTRPFLKPLAITNATCSIFVLVKWSFSWDKNSNWLNVIPKWNPALAWEFFLCVIFIWEKYC